MESKQELPIEKFKRGDKVRHPEYGTAEVFETAFGFVDIMLDDESVAPPHHVVIVLETELTLI